MGFLVREEIYLKNLVSVYLILNCIGTVTIKIFMDYTMLLLVLMLTKAKFKLKKKFIKNELEAV